MAGIAVAALVASAVAFIGNQNPGVNTLPPPNEIVANAPSDEVAFADDASCFWNADCPVGQWCECGALNCWCSSTTPACGNGLVESGEQCDDHNDTNTDACKNNCTNAICGDSVIWAGTETCDDGANNGSYGYCNATCTGPGPSCGDGNVDLSHEECDDGGTSSGDGCDATCQLECTTLSCGATITASTKLCGNIGTCTNDGIRINQDNTNPIILDCDNHTLTGNKSGSQGQYAPSGVEITTPDMSSDADYVIVRNCNIHNFMNGVTALWKYGGSGKSKYTTLENNTITSASKNGYGIMLWNTRDSVVQGNDIDNFSIGIFGNGANYDDILNNTITNNKRGLFFQRTTGDGGGNIQFSNNYACYNTPETDMPVSQGYNNWGDNNTCSTTGYLGYVWYDDGLPTSGKCTYSCPAVCGNGVIEGSEQCDGGACCTGSCTYSSGSTTCRASSGACDVAETCTGSSATCPADTFQPALTVCRASADICDIGETCTGSSPSCPTDSFQPASTVCRASGGVCDVAETCTGSAAACPADGFAS
ncbi:NosD domain-containing protein, partial [candidate division KSB1 bacterium]